MINGKKVSVVVPVYNEEKTVAGVLEALVVSVKLDEIICVDDGSSDGTAMEVDKYKSKLKVIHFPHNKGKGAAMAEGIRRAKGDVIVFCDSDLLGLKAEDIEKLASVLVRSKARVVLGQPQGKSKEANLFSSLVGERAYYRMDLLPIIGKFRTSRLGVETYLNSRFPEWKNVEIGAYHLEKYEKMPITQATMQYIREGVEIVKTKAKLNGWWNEEWNDQLEGLLSVKDWISWEKNLKRMKNIRLVRLLRKYVREYSNKLGKIIAS